MPEKHNCIVVPVMLRPDLVSPNTACFGVIVKCDETGYFGFKTAQGDESAVSRIVSFFPKYGRRNFEQAMAWAAHDIEYAIEQEQKSSGAFYNLIRPRENVIRYGMAQTSKAVDPAAELDRQYEQLVH
jgi:hypothetical protein